MEANRTAAVDRFLQLRHLERQDNFCKLISLFFRLRLKTEFCLQCLIFSSNEMLVYLAATGAYVLLLSGNLKIRSQMSKL